MDGADLLGLCSDNLVYECPLTEGIERGDLSPFRYFGIADDVDYTPLPWRGGRFDPEALTEAAGTQERAQHALDVWRDKGGGRTLAFCVTVTHADFMADFFSRNGVAAAAVHSGPTSAPRALSVDRLRAGELQVICTAYDVGLVDILRAVTRVGARSALDDYCRSYADERGHRPSALQVYQAGYSPSAARGRHGHWFGFLDDMELLGEREREVVRRHADVLDGIEKESITKSYKLVTLQTLLQMNKLRSGADVAEIAWAAHRIVTGDPRLLADTKSADMPDPASVSAGAWREYWLNWPLSAWAGRLRGASGGWFRIDGRRFVPAFQVNPDVGETFDAMVEELVDYRLARYLFTKGGSPLEAALRLKVIQAHGQPILMLDRGSNPQLPEGKASFIANDVIYTGNFAKIALNVARRAGQPDNALAGLLRSWFGADAGQPGTVQYVELVPGEPHWQMRPASPPPAAASRPADTAD